MRHSPAAGDLMESFNSPACRAGPNMSEERNEAGVERDLRDLIYTVGADVS